MLCHSWRLKGMSRWCFSSHAEIQISYRDYHQHQLYENLMYLFEFIWFYMYICTQTYARTYIHYIFIHIVSSASPLARSRRGTPSDPPRQELFGSSEVSQNTAQIKTTNIVIIYQLKKKKHDLENPEPGHMSNREFHCNVKSGFINHTFIEYGGSLQNRDKKCYLIDLNW